MIYPYRCNLCGYKFDVVKSVAERNDPEFCQQCSALAERYIAKTYHYGASDWNRAEYNPAFGKVIKSKSHLREEMRIVAGETGNELIEIGNESVDKLAKYAHNRQNQIRSERWKKADEELGLNG